MFTKQRTVRPVASPDTLQGDWLVRLRLAVELNVILDEAEGR